MKQLGNYLIASQPWKQNDLKIVSKSSKPALLKKFSLALEVKGSRTPFKDLDLLIISDKEYPLFILNSW